MSEVFEYSPQQVQLIVAGYPLTGWQTIRIARNAQSFIPIRGIRGKNTRVLNPDTSATITIPLIQTSQGNDVLSQIHELDRQRGTGRLTLTLKDGSGQSVFSSDEAYITSFPEVGFSGEIEYRTWSFFCQTTTFHVGGNASPQAGNLLNQILGQVGNFFG